MKKLCTLALATLLLFGPAHAEDIPIKFTLDWKIQGVHGWFYLAKEKGYFADEGLDVTIDQGAGSAATVTRIMSGAYDAGFGDMNAIIQNAATNPDEAPVMVYQIYNQPPFAVLTKTGGPVTDLKSLEGRNVGAPPGSASTKLFPALAEAAGFDVSSVEITSVAPNLQEQMLIQGQVDASLVFNVTSYLNIIGLGMDPDTEFTWFPYGEAGLDIYSNGVMVSPKLIADHPEAVTGLVSAIAKAMADVIADPLEGVAIIKKIEPLSNEELELKRLQFALNNLIYSDESRVNGIGAVDPARLGRSIEIIKGLYDLPTTPEVSAVFSDAYLPPLEMRSY
ncbi:MAG: NitT/TauT family transport system substrate-binding protein [Granulosicoccus sp.]|jgi:NitT/TauT family transport system substrate-binding protein